MSQRTETEGSMPVMDTATEHTETEGSELVRDAASGNPDDATVNLSAVLQESQVGDAVQGVWRTI